MFDVAWEGRWVIGGRGRGKLRRGGRETQIRDQELSVISSKYIDKLAGQTMRCVEELCDTLLWKLVICWEGPCPLLEVRRPLREAIGPSLINKKQTWPLSPHFSGPDSVPGGKKDVPFLGRTNLENFGCHFEKSVLFIFYKSSGLRWVKITPSAQLWGGF